MSPARRELLTPPARAHHDAGQCSATASLNKSFQEWEAQSLYVSRQKKRRARSTSVENRRGRRERAWLIPLLEGLSYLANRKIAYVRTSVLQPYLSKQRCLGPSFRKRT